MENTGNMEYEAEVLAAEVTSEENTTYSYVDDSPLLDQQEQSEIPKKNIPDDDDDETVSTDAFDITQIPTYYTAIRLVPLTTLFGLCYGLVGPAFTQLMIIRVCGQLCNYSAEVCNHLNEDIYVHQADKVRALSAQYQLYNTLISSIPSILFSLILGSWSDQFGRKLPMLLPFFGTLFSHAYMVLCSYIPMHPGFLLISPIISSISGGQVITHMAMFSYIGDLTTKKSRAINIAIIDGVMFLAANGGQYLGGFTMQHYGIPIPYIIVCGLDALSVMYIILVIRDRQPRKKMKEFALSTLFSGKRVLENWEMLKKNRPGNTRLHIFLILGCMLVSSVCLMGDGSIMQLFLEFRPFNWSLEFYTLYSAIQGTISSFAFVIAVVVLRKVFHVPDTMLALIACVSGIGMFFGFSIAVTDWMIYAATAVGVFRMLVIVIIRSLLSGMVERNEIGKIMSLISSLHSITPLLGSLIFANIFSYTAAFWPGLCFVVGAFMMVPVLAVFAYVDVARRNINYGPDEHM